MKKNNTSIGDYVISHPGYALKCLCKALDWAYKHDNFKYDQLLGVADKYGYDVKFCGKHILVKKDD